MRIKINKNGKETIIDVNNKYIKEVDQEINIDDSDDRIIQINKNKINKGRSIKNKLNSALPLLCTQYFCYQVLNLNYGIRDGLFSY